MAFFGSRTAEADAGANIGAADGPKGEPQDAASLSGKPDKLVIPGLRRALREVQNPETSL
jgi:hypothetical protein